MGTYIFPRVFLCCSLFYIEGYSQTGRWRKNGQWWPGPMARFSPLHLFIARIDNMTPHVGQGRFHTHDEKGIVPGSRSESPLQNPASQSTLDMNCHMVHQKDRLPSSLQDVNVGEGIKGLFNHDRCGRNYSWGCHLPSLQVITIIPGDATFVEN